MEKANEPCHQNVETAIANKHTQLTTSSFSKHKSILHIINNQLSFISMTLPQNTKSEAMAAIVTIALEPQLMSEAKAQLLLLCLW